MRLIDADRLRYKDMSNGQAPGGVYVARDVVSRSEELVNDQAFSTVN